MADSFRFATCVLNVATYPVGALMDATTSRISCISCGLNTNGAMGFTKFDPFLCSHSHGRMPTSSIFCLVLKVSFSPKRCLKNLSHMLRSMCMTSKVYLVGSSWSQHTLIHHYQFPFTIYYCKGLQLVLH